jgi:hypothetical protein
MVGDIVRRPLEGLWKAPWGAGRSGAGAKTSCDHNPIATLSQASSDLWRNKPPTLHHHPSTVFQGWPFAKARLTGCERADPMTIGKRVPGTTNKDGDQWPRFGLGVFGMPIKHDAAVASCSVALTRRGALPYKPRTFSLGGLDAFMTVTDQSVPLLVTIGPQAAIYGVQTGEADLSTEQARAQASPRLSCPHGDQGRPQGPQRAPGSWPQAPQRLKRSRRHPALFPWTA